MRPSLLALVLLASAAFAQEEPPRPMTVLTTFQPLYSLAARLAEGSERIRVENLAPRALGPHDYDPSAPEHRAEFERRVREATAIVTLRSLRLAPAFDRVYPLARAANVFLVEIDPAAEWGLAEPRLPLLANPGERDVHRGANPHVWLSLSHMAILATRVARDFALLDPPGAALYGANARRFQADLLRLRAGSVARFAELPDLSVVALTEGFPYLTADLDVDVVAYALGDVPPEEIALLVERTGARAVLAEEDPDPAVRRAIEGTTARLVVLSTLEEGWGEGDALAVSGYLDGMRSNLEALHEALRRP